MIEPIRLYNNDNISDEINDVCSICLDNINSQPVHELPECKHKFHSSCLITWLRINNDCPMCRSKSKSKKIYKQTVFQHIIKYCKSKKNTSKQLKSIYSKYVKLRDNHKLVKKRNKQFKSENKSIIKKNREINFALWKAQSKLYNIKKEISSLPIQIINK